ncbi:MAG: anhydro-N-acetylmuramic acid kinase [Bacteroidota bacterium]|jgi:anhydro-N-acetylmuramic acid kinase
MSIKIIGVMSGTSCDGLDLCLVTFDFKEQNYTYKIHKALMVDYPLYFQKKLKEAIHLSGLDLIKLSVEWTDFLVNAIQNNFDRNEYDLISSHGHTVFHQPHLGFTYQIGNLDKIAAHLNCDVVGDFRPMDVALGGQGAPLVPIGDEKLFSEYDCCLNLGGIANISLKENQKRLALDVAPFNLVINQLVASLGWLMDKDGEEANRGVVNEDLLTQLNKVSFYSIKGVKSLGKEYIDANFSFIHTSHISLADKLCTFNHHVAFQINKLIAPKVRKVLITGGGAYNKHFINCLNTINSNTDWFVPSKETVDFKEALIFAFLGYLRVNNQINIYNSYTGAQKNSIAGHLVKG